MRAYVTNESSLSTDVGVEQRECKDDEDDGAKADGHGRSLLKAPRACLMGGDPAYLLTVRILVDLLERVF